MNSYLLRSPWRSLKRQRAALIAFNLLFSVSFIFVSSSTHAQNPSPVSTGSGSGGDLVVPPSPTPASSTVSSTPRENPPVTTPASKYVLKDAPARIPRFETAPTIDGRLDEPMWQNSAFFGEFLQTNPGDNIAPAAPTEVMMAYDAKNLYVAFVVKQDRDKVRASVARRDNIFNDDYVGLYLDTFNDQRQAYAFFFNPLGVQADGTFSENNGEDFSVDLVMESKGELTPDGYTIEIAIPFKSLRYEAGKDKQWGLHIFRRIKYNNNELDSWMRNNRSMGSSLAQAGHITGMEGIATTRQLELNPSITVSESGRRTSFTFNGDPAGRYVNEGVKGEFGLTAKFSLTPTITLDFAYNPDFAQVEADSPVTTANQRFPIFFREKRPFFLERFDIFRSSLDVLNTRAIVDPDVAVKITGRRDKNTFGVLYASDNAPGNYSKDERQSLLECQQAQIANPALNCGIARFVDQNADIGILRYKRDIGRENNLGIFATTYNFVDRHNNTFSVDGRFRFDPKSVGE
ncbi:MAG: carbohydrate binding family 9 domain-containing protein, partial [Pyrinomonadaceae bacterium]